jgi:hypothetical protein
VADEEAGTCVPYFSLLLGFRHRRIVAW